MQFKDGRANANTRPHHGCRLAELFFGFYYFQFGKAVSRTLSLLHFWMAQCALIGLIIGLLLVYSGKTQYEPIAAVSSIAYALSFLVFAVTAAPIPSTLYSICTVPACSKMSVPLICSPLLSGCLRSTNMA